ncbi:MAG: hypothetical protein KDF60_12695 [Calditrichaeota bacterium]|nr:hypothetical protein [Calditrichota bacterium]
MQKNKLSLILFLSFIIVLVIGCSNEREPRFSIDDQIKDLKQKLELSDQQADQIRTILEEQRDQFEKLREEAGGDRSQMRERFMQVREETDSKIKDILDDDQKEKYGQIQEERRERMRRPRQQ